jgi:hypothetical protein
MAFDAVLGRQSLKEKQVVSPVHPPIILTYPCKENHGILDAGVMLSLNAEGKVIPYTKYVYLSETQDYRFTLGAGNGSNTTFNGTLPNSPIASLSVEVQAGNVIGKDDGCGRITGAGISGTINYETGEINITFSSAPANGTAIKVAYATRPIGVLTHILDTTKESVANVLVHGCVVKANLLVKVGDNFLQADDKDLARLRDIYGV